MSCPRPVRAGTAPAEVSHLRRFSSRTALTGYAVQYELFTQVYDSPDITVTQERLMQISCRDLNGNDVLLVEFTISRRMLCAHQWSSSMRPVRIIRLLKAIPSMYL